MKTFRNRAEAEKAGLRVQWNTTLGRCEAVDRENGMQVGIVLTALEAQLVEALEAVDAEIISDGFCPLCRALVHAHTDHAPGCKLVLALKAARGETI